MVLTTDTYWDVNGVPLQTLAYNITTWGGNTQAPPELRGDDYTIPYRPGTVFQPRRPKGNTLVFSMWVQGSDVDGKVPVSATQRAEFEKNYKMLRALFYNQGRQITVTKRWKNYGSGTVQTAAGKAVYVTGLDPTMQGGSHATLTVELYMSDPFFYGAQQTITFAATATSNQSPTILGDYETTDVLIDFVGARNNMRLTNTTEGVYVNVNNNLGAGNNIVVDVNNFTAVRNPLGTPLSVIGAVTSFGHPYWFVLRPGVQALSMTSSSGSGATSTVKYRPRWF